MNDPSPVPLTLRLPQITPDGKRLAQDLADASFTFQVDGAERRLRPWEVTVPILRGEAERIAAIPDPQARATEIFQTLAACVQMTAHAQALGVEAVRTADELSVVAEQLKGATRLTVCQPGDSAGS